VRVNGGWVAAIKRRYPTVIRVRWGTTKITRVTKRRGPVVERRRSAIPRVHGRRAIKGCGTGVCKRRWRPRVQRRGTITSLRVVGIPRDKGSSVGAVHLPRGRRQWGTSGGRAMRGHKVVEAVRRQRRVARTHRHGLAS
jgi:hypothetical protein